jgi:hypothetical protein
MKRADAVALLIALVLIPVLRPAFRFRRWLARQSSKNRWSGTGAESRSVISLLHGLPCDQHQLRDRPEIEDRVAPTGLHDLRKNRTRARSCRSHSPAKQQNSA